jgi:hypothetical protein
MKWYVWIPFQLYGVYAFKETETFIRYGDKPPCVGCTHYVPCTFEGFESTYSKCDKFGRKDVHTGEIAYDYATSARGDDTRCGVEGKYFKTENYLCLKKADHSLKRLAPAIAVILTLLFLYRE